MMCTLSLFKTDMGYEVLMNRDEKHDRRDALAPTQLSDSKYSVFGPLDPEGGGTWIAYNKFGYWGCLLNYYSSERLEHRKEHYKSRGQILVELLQAENPFKEAENINTTQYRGFQLVVGSAKEHKIFKWTGEKFSSADFHVSYQNYGFFLSSSSWNEEKVIAIRKGIFQKWIEGNENKNFSILDVHSSREPEDKSAIFMERENSGTKSITSMLVQGQKVDMIYDDFSQKKDVLSRAIS